jgi:cyclopropane fatty-acyl-phospholipid synthase-like methyltransferase
MTELMRAIRIVGWKQAFRLYRAYRVGWIGIISGFFTTRTMQALFNVGFFDRLQERGAVDVEAFARERDLEPEILRSLCDSLYSLGILSRQGTRYALEPKGRLLVEVARGWFEGVYGYEGVFHELEALLRREKEYGRDLWRRADFVARGSGQMEKWLFFPLVADVVRRNGVRTVLDLGCGEGTFLRALCEEDPRVQAYGVDVAPDAIAQGIEHVKAAGLQDRVQLFVEDVGRLPALAARLPRIDMATTFFVLHEVLFHGAEKTIDFLRGFRTAFPGVPLLVFEALRPSPDEMRKRPGMGIQYVLQHDLTHQRLVGREEWKHLFQQAGFRRVEERHLRFSRTAMFTLC